MTRVIQLHREAIVEKCNGCSKVIDEGTRKVCSVYLVPEAKWKIGNCPMASHLEKKEVKEVWMDPLKKSKKEAKKKH